MRVGPGARGVGKAPTFEAFVAESLVPCLGEGDVVVWDNARVHSLEAVALTEAVGARVLPQPPYSQDLNATEPMWSKVKWVVRQKLVDARDALLGALDEAVSAVTPSDAAGWIEHFGYTFLPDRATLYGGADVVQRRLPSSS